MAVPEKTRVDKWLWSVRIYKTRTLASHSCGEGKVKINGNNAKSSATVKAGDAVMVKKNGFNMTYKVISPIANRVGAPIAITCYQNITPEEELNKYNAWFTGANAETRERGTGRPTKRDRREIDDFKDGDETDNPFGWYIEDEGEEED